EADRSSVPGAAAIAQSGAGYRGQVTGRAAGARVPAQGRPSDQTAHAAMREFSTNAYATRDRKEGAA
ncbi:MAG: hypothetical protein KDI53_16945, partial [Candidatus Accumulibacter sp.]|nr:hypothetical protein [Accumulibacter sp.]